MNKITFIIGVTIALANAICAIAFWPDPVSVLNASMATFIGLQLLLDA